MRKTIAYFHLPGLFEAYAFYRVFLPLFFEHREYFYDWCAIGSLYGAPADCIWGGGRVGIIAERNGLFLVIFISPLGGFEKLKRIL